MSALLLALALAAQPTQETLIERSTDWSYLDDGSDQGSLWSAPQFDDSSWPTGTAEFGYGDGDEQTIVASRMTTYYRREFNVADPSDFEALEIRLKRDDGAVVYLNGAEIVRSNLNPGLVTFATGAIQPQADGAEEAYFPFYDRPLDLVAGVNVLAVEVHLFEPNSNDCSFDLELIGHRDPAVIRGPYVQMTSSTAATIRFRTVTPTVGQVTYGEMNGALTQVVSGSGLTVEHEIRITGLEAATKYFYAVGNAQMTLAGGDSEHWFRTAPPVGSRTPMRIWALGDCGTYDDRPRRVRDAYEAMSAGRQTDLMLFLGDNAYRTGTDLEYQLAIFETYDEQMRNTPAWSTRGNHEVTDAPYFTAFTLPDQGQSGGLPSGCEDYYSFDFGNVHFVCLDSFRSDRSTSGPMYRWCEGDLQSTDQDWIVAFFHHPPYSKGGHDSDTEVNLKEMREVFVPLLEDHGVAVVLSGHSHSYERSYLLDGHHGDSSSFSVGIHAVDAGLGREVNGVGAYTRAPGPHGGAVYMVSGSAGRVGSNSSGNLDHPAMAWAERKLGSVALDVVGGRMDVRFLDDLGVQRDWFTLVDSTWDGSFCIGSVNGEGCVATLSAVGTPSFSSSQPFSIVASDVRTNATSLLVYGTGTFDMPLAGGRLCVGPSLRRTIPGDSGGTGPCGGSYAFDFTSIFGSTMHPDLTVGSTVYCQVWYRDTTPELSSLSEGLLFTILP
jgi:hypothetical protein